MPNWRHFGVIATSKSFFIQKLPYLDSSHNFLLYIFWWLFPISRILGSKSTFFFIAQKDKKWPNWRLYDVILTSKKNPDEKNYTFLDSSQNFLEKTFWWFFHTSRILGSKSKKACFWAFSIYFLYKIPIKWWFSKKLFATHFPSSQISKKIPY